MSASKAAVPQDLARKRTGEKLEKEEQRNATRNTWKKCTVRRQQGA